MAPTSKDPISNFLFRNLKGFGIGRAHPKFLIVAILAFTLLMVLAFDLSPKVESDFFFASDDPALASSTDIDRTFKQKPQLLLGLQTDTPFSNPTIATIEELTLALEEIPSTVNVVSFTRGPLSPSMVPDGPFWSRLLWPDKKDLALLVALPENDWHPADLKMAENLVRERSDTNLILSGVPWIVELIRRSLERDFLVFTLITLILFGALSVFFFRSFRLAFGAVLTCLGATAGTLALLYIFRIPIGILTANVAAIIFVLTLSHTVFLTENWRRLGDPMDAAETTFGPSFWAGVTTLLGFSSLLTATARPMRELGIAGIAGTLMAFIATYGAYLCFLTHETPRGKSSVANSPKRFPKLSILILLLGLISVGSVFKLNFDPSLLSFFDAKSEIHQGLSLLDERGGSSPLVFVVEDPSGGALDTNEAMQRIERAHLAVEADSSTGIVLSPFPMVKEARRFPLLGFLKTSKIIDILSGDRFSGVAQTVITADRRRALITIRMRETGRNEPRPQIENRLRTLIESEGLRVTQTGGLYHLQGVIATLVRESLLRGLLLFALAFAAISYWISRDLTLCIMMTFSFCLFPLGLFSFITLSGRHLDLLSTPALNVAMGVGVDAMLHMVMRFKQFRQDFTAEVSWSRAWMELRDPILKSACLLGIGFAIFLASSFPPTRNFGLLVMVGTLLAAGVTLTVLPTLGSWRPPQADA